MKDNTNPYLSDEELLNLIEDVEQHHMVHAPSYLEEQTMHRLQKRLNAQKQISKNRRLFYFSSKVIAATAASLALLFVTPDPQSISADNQPKKDSVSFTQKIYSATDRFCDAFAEHTNKLITFGGTQYDK